jgi:hypothetical protein
MGPKFMIILWLIFFSALLQAAPAAGGAITLPQTGQTLCYNSSTPGTTIPCAGTGQDGDRRAGLAWPTPRFQTVGDCVSDNLTGLMWSRNANRPGGARTWQQALDYVASVNSGSGLCGYFDWRLPNVNELESLVHADWPDTSDWLNTQGFELVQEANYWSSSTSVDDRDYAWAVGLWDGYLFPYAKNYEYFVWPVRNGF